MSDSDKPSLTDIERLRRSVTGMASWQNAQLQLRNSRYAAALTGYSFLVQQFPGVPQLWIELATAAAGDLEYPLAEEALQCALKAGAGDSGALVAIGRQYYHLRRMEQTAACFEQAVAASPSSADARLNLASWFEQNRQLDKARECVETCLAQHPQNGRAICFQAYLLHHTGQSEKAETLLRDLLKREGRLGLDVQSNASHLLGVLLDARGEFSEALGCMIESKEARRELSKPANIEKTYDVMSQLRSQLLGSLTGETIRRWRDESTPSPNPLALLAGAPRSGTTLVEQILGAHPEILVFDEPEAFTQELSGTAFPEPAWQLTFKSLNNFATGARERFVARYFKRLLHESREALDNRLLLDKNPSITGLLHIWLRFFPHSKILVALRDPRDVVISCFFQNIQLNLSTVNFLSLDRTVKFYSECMNVWLRLRELGGFEWVETRYEDMVANFVAEGQKLTKFLGLSWLDEQTKYHEKASQKFLHAPTYNAVTKPVYTKAVKRWEHYADALSPHLSILAPHLRAFGYS